MVHPVPIQGVASSPGAGLKRQPRGNSAKPGPGKRARRSFAFPASRCIVSNQNFVFNPAYLEFARTTHEPAEVFAFNPRFFAGS